MYCDRGLADMLKVRDGGRSLQEGDCCLRRQVCMSIDVRGRDTENKNMANMTWSEDL